MRAVIGYNNRRTRLILLLLSYRREDKMTITTLKRRSNDA